MNAELVTQAAHLEVAMIAQHSVLQTISALPSTAANIDIQHTDTVATAGLARHIQAGIASVVDATIDQIEQTCRERVLLVQLYRRQLSAWRRIALNAAEAAEIDRLDQVINAETAIVAEVLAIAKQNYGSTDARLAVKSSLELQLEALLRNLPELRSYRVRQSYRPTYDAHTSMLAI